MAKSTASPVISIGRILLHALHSGDEWSSGLVVLGLCGASLLMAASSGQTSR